MPVVSWTTSFRVPLPVLSGAALLAAAALASASLASASVAERAEPSPAAATTTGDGEGLRPETIPRPLMLRLEAATASGAGDGPARHETPPGPLMLRLEAATAPGAGDGARSETPLGLDAATAPGAGEGLRPEAATGLVVASLGAVANLVAVAATGAAGPVRPGPATGRLDLADREVASPHPGIDEPRGEEPTGYLDLTLERTIRLALGRTRDAVSARITRDEQLLALEAAEERYDPRASVESSWTTRDGAAGEGNVSVGPSLRVPTGGSFRLAWSKPVAGAGDRSTRTVLSFSQPLLKGFGTDIDTVPLRKARMNEEVNVRAFRDAVAGLIGSVVRAYRRLLGASRRVAIARDALERAREQLGTNRALVDAGRMAPQELVQTRAAVADREYALLDAENALDGANASLADLLDVDEGIRIEPAAEPPAEHLHPDLEASFETAFARRTDWLRTNLAVERARMDLEVARNNLLPNLSLNTTVARGGDWSARMNLAVPLWDRSPERARVRARNALHRAEMAVAETRQGIRAQVRAAVRGVAVGLRQIAIAREGRELAERKLDIERLKLEQGLSSAYQLDRVEDDVVSAQNREVDALDSYRNALTSLDRELGTTLDRWGIRIEEVGR